MCPEGAQGHMELLYLTDARGKGRKLWTMTQPVWSGKLLGDHLM